MIMGKFEQYMNEQFVGENPERGKIGRDIFKALKENCVEKIGYIPQKPMAIIEVKKPGEVVLDGIGFSDPDDLLLDIFGAWLSGILTGGIATQRNLTDRNGIVRTIDSHVSSSGSNFNTKRRANFQPFSSVGSFMAIGQGEVAAWNPMKSDFQLRVPFVTPPESNNINVSGVPVWISNDQEAIITGLVSNTQLAGTVGECGLFCLWRLVNSATRIEFMLSHDKIAVPFGAGANLQITYTWSIN